jgi:antitoxin (DNA-binding transcriptional repressor) of toxin-antitoxin stability system
MYNRTMPRQVIRVSEDDATSDFASLLAHVRAGVEIIIERNAKPIAILHSAEPSLRLLSESLRLAREHGSTVTLDDGFASDLEHVINGHREPLDPPAWE